LLPRGNGGLVALDGFLGGPLHAEAQTPEQAPDLRVAVSHLEAPGNQLARAIERPQFGGKALCERAFLEQTYQFFAFARTKRRRSPEALGAQRRFAAARQRRRPLAHRLA
jgi:hypothetical protein